MNNIIISFFLSIFRCDKIKEPRSERLICSTEKRLMKIETSACRNYKTAGEISSAKQNDANKILTRYYLCLCPWHLAGCDCPSLQPHPGLFLISPNSEHSYNLG